MAQNSKAVHPKGDFFDLKGTGSNVKTEIVAGLTTFFYGVHHLRKPGNLGGSRHS